MVSRYLVSDNAVQQNHNNLCKSIEKNLPQITQKSVMILKIFQFTYLDVSMKKIALGLLATAIIATTTAQAATQSPRLRGELTQGINHAGLPNQLKSPVRGLPAPTVAISDLKTIPTVLVPANKSASVMMDVTLMDEFLDDIAPNARHYPTNFPSRTAEYVAKENIKYLSDWIEPLATAPDASIDVLLRAAKINGMARNMNIGTDYTLRASAHMQKALQVDPNNAEANFLLGMMLSETGAFKEGRKYLDKAASLGFVEAEQSIAQADLLSDNKSAALKRLRDLAAKNPNNAQIAEQIRLVESGNFYIWSIADNNLNIKSIEQ